MRDTTSEPSAQAVREPPRAVRRRPRRTSKKRKRPFPLPLRRTHLAWLVVGRHKKLPRDDDGWTYIKVAAEHCPYGPNRRDTLMEWLQSVCAPPWILRQVRQVAAILDRIPPRRWSADALGKLLHVSDAERTMLRIYTIGSHDVPRAKRIKRRKEKRRLADQARRRDNGSKPREQSFSRTKPWEAFGIKRRAWERRGKPMPMTTQIRGQYASLPLTTGFEFASSSSARNGNGKSNGKHGTRRQRRPPTKEGTSEQPLAAATARPSRVHHLTAVGIG